MDSIQIDTKEVDRIMSQLGTNRDGVVRMMAFEVEGVSKQLAPYDTTAMRNSIYTETSKESGYGQASSEAQEKRPDVTTIQHPKPEEGFANVGPSVNYAEYVELGTSRQAAQPFLTPAVEQVAQKYNSGEKWKELTK
jgi:HK97 gp10 family phage protein